VSQSFRVPKRPVWGGTLLSFALAGAVVVLLEDAALPGCLLQVVGLTLAAVSTHRARASGNTVLGGLGALVGGVLVVAGAGLAVASVSGIPSLATVGFGVAGVLVVGLGTLPLRGTGSRLFVKGGTALLLLSVVAAGLFREATLVVLLVAAAGVVVTWDAAENAITLGEQLGRSTGTWRVEATHLGGTGLAAGAAVVAGLFAQDLGTPGLDLHSLALLLVAVTLLTLALHD
jgi:hypothetical protein